MYVNIKILAAFPWFQSLNILVTLTLSHCQKRILALKRIADVLHSKGLKDPQAQCPSQRSLLSPEFRSIQAHQDVCDMNSTFQATGQNGEGHWNWT